MRNKKSFSFYLLFITMVSFFSYFLFGCNENDTLSGIITEKSLHGKWKETFEWSNPLINVGDSAYKSVKISTIDFEENKFVLTILPPLRGYDFDTLYTGVYSTYNDTLVFKIETDSLPHYFTFKIYSDSLRISQLPILLPNGLYAINLYEFLWGNSFNKHSGIFLRTSK